MNTGTSSSMDIWQLAISPAATAPADPA